MKANTLKNKILMLRPRNWGIILGLLTFIGAPAFAMAYTYTNAPQGGQISNGQVIYASCPRYGCSNTNTSYVRGTQPAQTSVSRYSANRTQSYDSYSSNTYSNTNISNSNYSSYTSRPKGSPAWQNGEWTVDYAPTTFSLNTSNSIRQHGAPAW